MVNRISFARAYLATEFSLSREICWRKWFQHNHEIKRLIMSNIPNVDTALDNRLCFLSLFCRRFVMHVFPAIWQPLKLILSYENWRYQIQTITSRLIWKQKRSLSQASGFLLSLIKTSHRNIYDAVKIRILTYL